ncbi:high affinity copper uptake protein 1-like isoform X2 [Mya arenaria]|uniref:high affinity copper uptake protein 1-like isoform X2 n=1 Tax=Mya arenaria TaxID=6604 RepID=UPI0022E2B0B3|nr:high affinity copper uptake protein 1-like isoform X2 [Mya arenaria]
MHLKKLQVCLMTLSARKRWLFYASLASVSLLGFVYLSSKSNMSTTMGHNHMGMTTMDHSGHTTADPHAGHEGMDMECGMGMMMYFHTGKCEYILFEGIRTTTSGGMIGACFAIFALGVLYEGLKVLRETLLQRAMVNKYAVGHSNSSQDTMVVSNKNVGLDTQTSQDHCLENDHQEPPLCIHMMSCSHFLQTLLHMVQVFFSYCLMLVFMTYNVWLCLSVILGAGVGYFLFGWRKAIVVDINEHCH